MTRFFSTILLSLFAGLAFAQAIKPAPAAPRQVKFLVVFPQDDEPYQVRKMTRGDFGRALVLTGLLPALIGEGIIKSRSEPLETKFNAIMKGFPRSIGFDATLRKSFAKRTRGTEIFSPSVSNEVGRYFSGKGHKQLLPAAAAEGFDYVLQLRPQFIGLITLNAAQGDAGMMSPMFDTGYRLFDARTAKQLHEGSASSNGLEGRNAEALVSDRAHFELVWPNLCSVVADLITAELFRQDQLNAMAKTVGRGDEVPAIEGVLARYAKKVRWKMRPAEGWRIQKLNSFVRVVEPKDARNQVMGIRFEVEALVPEFDTNVASVEEYLPVLQRNRLLYHPDATPLERFPDIDVPGFEAFASSLPAGAKHVLLLRKVSDDFIEIAILVFVKDFDTLYPANRALIEQMVAQSEVLGR